MMDITTNHNNNGKNEGSTLFTSHAVDRSNEFLSCAKTAVKVARSQHQKKIQQQQPHNNDNYQELWFMQIEPSEMALCNPMTLSPSCNNNNATDSMKEIVEVGCDLLRTMDVHLNELEVLVRRRGQTNDPTNEITSLVYQLEQSVNNLTVLIQDKMTSIITLLNNRYKQQQKQKHYQMIQVWFQNAMQLYNKRMKDILAVRATVLAEQVKRRKRFVSSTAPHQSAGATSSSSNHETISNLSSSMISMNQNATMIATAKTYQQSPLFATIPSIPPPQPPTPSHATTSTTIEPKHEVLFDNTVTTITTTSTAATLPKPILPPPLPKTSGGVEQSTDVPITYKSDENNYNTHQMPPITKSSYPNRNYYNNGNGKIDGSYKTNLSVRTTPGYGGNVSNLSYYQGQHTSSSSMTGMRQRKGANVDSQHQQYQSQFVAQQQQQQQQILAVNDLRLREARQAEKSLAELGSVFSKMSTIIIDQGETLNKIEDDIEAAQVDVTAGQQEITILYTLKKGNRMLIIKTFSLLIFFILFMRFYAR